MATPVRLRIDGDASGAVGALERTQRGLRGVDTQTGKVGKSASKMGSAFRTALASTAIRATAYGITHFLISSTKLYGELNDAISANQVAFGKDSLSIQAWARQSGPALMMTSRQVLEATTGFKLLLGNLGLAPKKANDASKTLTALAADMASFRGTSVQDAIDSLTSAVKGEMDPIEKYGVTLNEATIKAKAYEMGLYSGKGALDSTAKAQAVYAAILQQTAKIQGDAERTSGSYANQMRRLSVNWVTFKESVGKALVPLVEKYAPSLNSWLESMNSAGGINGMSSAFDKVANAIDGAIQKAKSLWDSFSASAGESGASALQSAYESISAAAEKMAGWAGSAVNAFNKMSPETKENIALLIAAGAALSIAGRSPVIQLGLSLVASTLTRITGEAIGSAISHVFPNSIRIAGQPIRVVGNVTASGVAAGGSGTKTTPGAQFAAGLKMFGVAALASVVLPYLIQTLPLPPGAKQQVADIASIASYGAMGLAAFGPIGGVGGAIYGALRALVARDTGHDSKLGVLAATSDYLRGRTTDLSAEDRRIWRDSAEQARQIGVISASDYAQNGTLSRHRDSLVAQGKSIWSLLGTSQQHATAISGLQDGVEGVSLTAALTARRLEDEEILRRSGDQDAFNRIEYFKNNFSSLVGAWFAAHGGGGGAYASSAGGRAVNVIVQDRRLADLIDVEIGSTSALAAHQQVRRHRWA